MSRLLSALKNLQQQGRFPQAVDSSFAVGPESHGGRKAGGAYQDATPTEDSQDAAPQHGPRSAVSETPYARDASVPRDSDATLRDGGTSVWDDGMTLLDSGADLLKNNPPVLDVGLIQGTSASVSGNAAYADPGSGWLADSLPEEYSPTALLDALLEEKLGAYQNPEVPPPTNSPSLDTPDVALAEVDQTTAEPDIVVPGPVEKESAAVAAETPEFTSGAPFVDTAPRDLPAAAPEPTDSVGYADEPRIPLAANLPFEFEPADVPAAVDDDVESSVRERPRAGTEIASESTSQLPDALFDQWNQLPAPAGDQPANRAHDHPLDAPADPPLDPPAAPPADQPFAPAADQPSSGEPAGVRRQPVDVTAIADLHDPARASEYRTLAETIWSTCRDSQIRSVLLMGVSDESQLAGISASLALELAAMGEARVLLADGDIRDRRLTVALHQTATPGLAAGFDNERSSVPPAVPTTTPGLSFLPAGQPRSSIRRNDVHVLAELLRELAGRYDVVLIDGGSLPALPTEMLAEACDGTYLVIGLGETEIAAAKEIVEQVHKSGGRVLGCIALDAPLA